MTPSRTDGPGAHPNRQDDPFPLPAGAAVLRRLAASDLHDFQSYRRDAELARFQGWSPQSDAEALTFLQSVANAPLFQPGEWIQLAIAEAQSLKLVGDIGLFLAQDGSWAEVGFTLARPAQGAGLASSAVQATIGLVFARTSAAKVIAVTDQRNAASIRLLERLHMRLTETREAVFKGEPCTELVFALQRPPKPAGALPPVADLLAKLRALGVDVPAGPVRADGYGDSPELSTALLALIRDGRKRAGTSLLWAMQAEGEALPQVGQIEIVVDHLNEPALITRITRVETLPYNQVTAEYAAIEGEGDGSLAYWREAHWAFFSRECQRIGCEPALTMPVVCSVFEVLSVLPHRAA